MVFIEIFFLSILSILIIGFLAYFLLMLHFSRKPSNLLKKAIFPSVSLIIAAYNEELVISKKLENTIEMEYPKDKLEILVVDDGSTDRTNAIARDFAVNHKDEATIRLIAQEKRMGKASALNRAMKQATGDIVILSDADVLLEKDSIQKLISNFVEKNVGAVSGIEVIKNADQSSTTQIEQGYRSFYNTIRLGESNLDSVIMCESEFAAYRRGLIKIIPPDSLCDDMELTLSVRKQGFRAIYEPASVFHECTPPKYKSRLKHKIRRGQGIQQTLLRYSNMMFKRKYGAFAFIVMPFEFFMHLVSPILIPILLITGIAILISSSNLLAFFVLGILLISLLIFITLRIVSPAFSITLKDSSNGASSRFLLVLYDFLTLQVCLLIGLILLGIRGPKVKWEQMEEVRRSISEQ
jgi:cellulose synthase/poly-beta-1,6-N-acetylglucosamine synthase-like glycosyltransferase